MSSKDIINYCKSINVELVIWPLALIFLLTLDPHVEHMSICPLNNLGFEHCPGCGLGRSISLIFRGEYSASFNAHPFGFIALLILAYRIVHLAFLSFKKLASKKNLS